MSHMMRPPPSKSMKVTVTGESRVSITWSWENEKTLAGTLVNRYGSISSLAWHATQTRCGGYCGVPQLRHLVPVSRISQGASRHWAAGDGMRSSMGGRAAGWIGTSSRQRRYCS